MPRLPRIPLSRLLVLGLLAFAPVGTNSAESSACRAASSAETLGVYPEHPLSPKESVDGHDAVFLGEVLVPTRRCSLGYCAGIKVLRTLKGDPGQQMLIRVAHAADDRCAPTLFSAKGGRWMVFANGGTSKTGHRYLQASTDGPTFASTDLPDLNALEGRYRVMRARLDQAIDQSMGRLR